MVVRDESRSAILAIVAFASYPVLTAMAAECVARRVDSHHYLKQFAVAFGLIGFAPAAWLNYPEPKVYMVAPIAGLVVIMCFVATGALVGALIDLKAAKRTRKE